ncbi:methionine adenosyltransferase [Promicromonospora sp. CA-289599]|uniref:methionine adenosyltransferase n=1 Tax=Promicromonospora sp. CA-289599 TaxID=3240014 RepID=UPI003D8F9C0E
MDITVFNTCTDPDRLPFDVAERKGIGHPDSLADMVADTFSREYSIWCLNEFGLVPNHWVDKVNLVGAAARVEFGKYEILKPADAYLFGKITDRVGATEIPIGRIFSDVVGSVLPAALGDSAILDHVRTHVNNTRGIGIDHDPQFYVPEAVNELAGVLAAESVANDTVICVGTSHRGISADLATRLEGHITGSEFRRAFPAVGTDVKVMIVRIGASLDITAAVPFHPELVDTWPAYSERLGEVRAAISDHLRMLQGQDERLRRIDNMSLSLNTKDVPGRGYLAPFGTSLGKGDCGAVGRGNRYNGAIEPLRPSSCEAAAGKNPVHHVGKIYTAVTFEIAKRIFVDTGVYAEVTIAARNGGRLDDPAHVLVSTERKLGQADIDRVKSIVGEAVGDATHFQDTFLAADPVERFRELDAR